MNNPGDNGIPTSGSATVGSESGRRRWIPATATLGGLVAAGVLFVSTAGASEPSADHTSAADRSAAAAASDDGGGSVTAEPTAPGTPAAPAEPSATDEPSAPVGPPADGPGLPATPDGTAPAPPAARVGVPVPASPGAVPAPPAGGPAADGSEVIIGTVAASSDTTITVQPDSGDAVTASFTSDTHFRSEPSAPGSNETAADLTAADLSLGKRVEIRVVDGTIVDAGLVVAHADGTVTAVSDGTATVITRDGLKISLDLSSSSSTVEVGDHVHARGTVDPSGSTIDVSSIEDAEN